MLLLLLVPLLCCCCCCCCCFGVGAGVPVNTELGQYPSLMLHKDSNAISISYGSEYGLKFATCSQTHCNSPVISHVGCTPPLSSSSLVFVDGSVEMPFMAVATRQFAASSDLHTVSCSDRACSHHQTNRIAGPNAGYASSVLVGANGLPVIAYLDRESSRLGIAFCLDRPCSNVHISYPSSLGGTYGSWGTTDILLAQPRPQQSATKPHKSSKEASAQGSVVVSFQRWDLNGTTGSLVLAVCQDDLCDKSELRSVDTSASEFSSLSLDGNGRTLIAYVDTTYTILRLARCSKPGCPDGSITIEDVFLSASNRPLSFPVVRVDPWSNRPVFAFFRSSPRGGELLVLTCRTPDCAHVSPLLDSVVVDMDPEWSTSDMQLSMEIRSDGRPVIAYSVYKPPSTSYLKVAVCESPECFYSRLFVMDTAKSEPQLQLSLNVHMLMWTLALLLILLAMTLASARYYRNGARLVNAYTLMAFTSSVVVDAHYKRTTRACLCFTIMGALLSSVSWLLYCPGEMSALWLVMVLYWAPVVAAAVICVALSFPRRIFLVVSVGVSSASLVLLDVAMTLVVNSHTLECNETLNATTPRTASLIGGGVSFLSILVSVFLATRVHTAVCLAKPDGRMHRHDAADEHMLD